MPHRYLSDFELIAVLGVGTVGTVYDARVRTDIGISPSGSQWVGQDLAIKMLGR